MDNLIRIGSPAPAVSWVFAPDDPTGDTDVAGVAIDVGDAATVAAAAGMTDAGELFVAVARHAQAHGCDLGIICTDGAAVTFVITAPVAEDQTIADLARQRIWPWLSPLMPGVADHLLRRGHAGAKSAVNCDADSDPKEIE